RRRRLLEDLFARSTQRPRTAVAKVLWICRHDIHCLLRHELDYPRLPDLPFRLSAKVSWRADGHRRRWFCGAKLPADSRAPLRFRRAADVDVSGRAAAGSVAAGERRQRSEMESEA